MKRILISVACVLAFAAYSASGEREYARAALALRGKMARAQRIRQEPVATQEEGVQFVYTASDVQERIEPVRFSSRRVAGGGTRC